MKHRGAEVYLLGASIVWALVIIDTGEVGWPIAVWMVTALLPVAQQIHKRDAESGNEIG